MNEITANFISERSIWNTPFAQNLKRLCLGNGITLEPALYNEPGQPSHFDVIKAHTNIASWGLHPAPMKDMKQNDKTVLFLENGMIRRGKAIFVDDEGWHDSASYVVTGRNRDPITAMQGNEVREILESVGVPILCGGDKNGPILLTLQNQYVDSITVDLAAAYLPRNKKVLIRRFPKAPHVHGEESINKAIQNPNWSIQDSSIPLIESLRKCSALVTRNSGTAITALGMGIPVATLGRGLFSGSFATLECDRNPFMLKHIVNFKFDHIMAERLLYCIHSNEVPLDAPYELVFENVKIQNWIRRILQK